MNAEGFMTLYHFTSLMHLPAILRVGITRGEVPLPDVPYKDRPQAPNLTRNPSFQAQRCWTGGPTDKTKVRLTVRLPRSEVTTFRQVRERYGLRAKWIKLLAPRNEHYDWFFAFNGVAPSHIHTVEVAVARPGEYVPLNQPTCQKLSDAIEAERSKLTFVTTSDGMTGFLVNDELLASCWVLDGPSYANFRAMPFALAA